MARMTQDALHPAEMKGKPHQSQKTIKARNKIFRQKNKERDARIKRDAELMKKTKATKTKGIKEARKKQATQQKKTFATKNKERATSIKQDAERMRKEKAAKMKSLLEMRKPKKAPQASKPKTSMAKKKAYSKGGGVDPEATKRRARNRKKVGKMAEKKKQDFLKAARKTLGKESFSSLYSSTPRQGKARATVRNIKASDVDKERSARRVSKKAEKARAKNDPKRAAKAKAAKAEMRKRMSIPAVNLLPGGMPLSLLGATAGGELKMRHGGPVKKDQGYNARLDESMGARNKTKKQQSLKSRRHESEAMEKKGGRRKYAAVKTMDKGRRTKKKPRGVGAALRGWGKAHHG